MCTEKHVLVKRIFTNRLNMCLLVRSRVGKIIHQVERCLHSGKEKVLGAMVSKEGRADSPQKTQCN